MIDMESTQQKIAMLQKMAMAFDKKFSDDQLTIYLEYLADYTPEQVAKAVKQLIASYSYGLPKIADIIKTIQAQETATQPSVELMAESEWSRLRENVRRLGRYREPKFDPTTAAVVENLGGGWAICDWYTDEMEWRHRDFVRLWQEFYGKEDFLGITESRAHQSALPSGDDTKAGLRQKFNLASDGSFSDTSKPLLFDNIAEGPWPRQ